MAPKGKRRRGAGEKNARRRGPEALRLELTLLALGRKPAEVFREAGVPENAMSMYLSGERIISRQNALKLKAAYGVTTDWLYAGDRTQLPSQLAAKIAALLGSLRGSQGIFSSSKASD
jgi:plasmid maintenance system antidote protein VapI